MNDAEKVVVSVSWMKNSKFDGNVRCVIFINIVLGYI